MLELDLDKLVIRKANVAVDGIPTDFSKLEKLMGVGLVEIKKLYVASKEKTYVIEYEEEVVGAAFLIDNETQVFLKEDYKEEVLFSQLKTKIIETLGYEL